MSGDAPQATHQAGVSLASATSDVGSFYTSSRYLLLVLIWSSTPLAVVWSVRELHPMWALASRFVLAAVLASFIVLLMKKTLRVDLKALHSYVAGSLSLLGAMLCTYFAAQYLASGLISLFFGLSPLLAGVVAVFVLRQQTLHVEQWIGMFIAFLGLLFICWMGDAALIQLKGVLFILAALLCYVGSMFWVKAVQAKLQPLVQTTGSLIVSAVGILPLLLFFWDDMPQTLPSVQSVIAIVYTVVFASIVAMMCYFDLVERLSPSTVALSTVITPVLALLWGTWLNHEPMSASVVLGAAVIMFGLVLYFVRDWLRHYRRKASQPAQQ